MSTNPGDSDYWGRVRRPAEGLPPPSTLVGAFGKNVDGAADAIVLRGYSGGSTIIERALELLEIARRNGDDETEIDKIKSQVKTLEPAAKNILRIYLTPRLDCYVDFHNTCLIGWRYEAKAERQDVITVWLRAYDNARVPIPYRVVQETRIGPSFDAYLGGDLIDDYLGQPGSVSTAWGDQSSVFGGRPGTGVRCGGRPGTGVRCGE